MDKNEKMRSLHSELVEISNKIGRYNNLSDLFDTLHDNDLPWGRGVLFGIVKGKLETAELLLKSVAFHLEYHINEAKKREVVEEDGA